MKKIKFTTIGFVLCLTMLFVSCNQEVPVVEEPLVEVSLKTETDLQTVHDDNTKTLVPTGLRVDYFQITVVPVGHSNPVPEPMITTDGNCTFSVKAGQYKFTADGYIRKGVENNPLVDTKVVSGSLKKNITISDNIIHIMAEAVSGGTGTILAKFTWDPEVAMKDGPFKDAIDNGKIILKVTDKNGQVIKSVDFTSFNTGLEVRVDNIPSGKNMFYSFSLHDDAGTMFYHTAPIATHIYPGQISVVDKGDAQAFNFTETFYPRYARNILTLKSVTAENNTIAFKFATGGDYEGIVFHLTEKGTDIKTIQTPEGVISGADKVYTLNVDANKVYDVSYQVKYKNGWITYLITDPSINGIQTNLQVPGTSVTVSMKNVDLKINQQSNGNNNVFTITSTPMNGAKDIVPESTEWLLGNPDDNPLKYTGADFMVNASTWYKTRKESSLFDIIDTTARTITSPLFVIAKDIDGNSYSVNSTVTIQAPFEYKVKEFSDHVVLTEYLGNDTYVVVPDSYNGKPVTRLEGTFHGKKNNGITDIILPPTVTYIGPNFRFDSFCFDAKDAESPILPPGEEHRFFFGDGGTTLTSLKSINLEHVKELGPYALSIYSENLTSIDLSSVEKIGICALIGIIEEIKGLQNLKEIEHAAMYCLTSLKKITLPAGLVRVGEDAFYGWTVDQTIRIPKNIDKSQWHSNWTGTGNPTIVEY